MKKYQKSLAVLMTVMALNISADPGNGNGSGNANSGGSNGNGNGNANSGGSNGQSSVKKPTFKAVTQTNLQDMVTRMSDGKLGSLLTSSANQDLLGGKCEVRVDQYGSTLYTLLIPGSPVKKIGVKQTPQLNVNFKQRNLRRFEKIQLPPAEVEETLRSSDEVDVALKELGATFKSEIADRQWPCGSSSAETSNLPFFDLKSEVKFYLDEETNETICIVPGSKKTMMRKADSCEMEAVEEVLPDDLCKYVEHIIRNEMQDEIEKALYVKAASESSGETAGGAAGGSGSGGTVGKTKEQKRLERLARREARKSGLAKTRHPKLDSEMKRKVRIARYVNTDPEIVTYVNTVKIPLADRFLSRETVDFLEDDSDEEVDFDTLPESSQVELTRLALSVESIRDEEDFVQPSGNLKEMMDAFRGTADSIIQNNEDLEMSLYRFPRKSQIKKNIQKRLGRLKDVAGVEYKTDLQCDYEPEPTVKVGKRMKKMIERGRNRKIGAVRLKNPRQTDRFNYTRQTPEIVQDRPARRTRINP